MFYFFFSGQARSRGLPSILLTWPQILDCHLYRLAFRDLGSSLEARVSLEAVRIIFNCIWLVVRSPRNIAVKILPHRASKLGSLKPKYNPKSESNGENISRPNPFWVHLNYIFNCVSIYHHSFFLTLTARISVGQKFGRFKFYSFIINPLRVYLKELSHNILLTIEMSSDKLIFLT